MKTLKEDPQNIDKDIAIKQNKLVVDGIVVDQNQFFRQKQVTEE